MKTLALLLSLLILPSCGMLESYEQYKAGGQNLKDQVGFFQSALTELAGIAGEVGVIVAEADTDGSGGISGLGEGMDLLFGVGGLGGILGLVNKGRKKETNELYDNQLATATDVAELKGSMKATLETLAKINNPNATVPTA